MNYAEWESCFKLPEKLVPVVEKVSKLSKTSSKEEWLDCLTELQEDAYRRYLCNDGEDSNGLFPNKRWTFQHHAAYHSAPKEVIEKMIEMGFPMSYKDGDMKIPLDYVADAMSDEYKALFKYKFLFENLDISKVNKIEEQFHKAIHSRVAELVKKYNLILPVLSVVLESTQNKKQLDEDGMYCAIPEMYGGFSFRFDRNEGETDIVALVTESWCRVSGGSGQRHKCTENEFTLVDEGFC